MAKDSLTARSYDSRHATTPWRRFPMSSLFGALALSLFAIGCVDDDVGVCCRTLKPDASIPEPMTLPNGDPTDNIAIDPAFDCEELTCVSYQAQRAYCTKRCEFDEGCPEGFVCQAVLQSSPGPDASIQPEHKFCVKAPHTCVE